MIKNLTAKKIVASQIASLLNFRYRLYNEDDPLYNPDFVDSVDQVIISTYKDTYSRWAIPGFYFDKSDTDCIAYYIDQWLERSGCDCLAGNSSSAIRERSFIMDLAEELYSIAYEWACDNLDFNELNNN